jgi:ferrous iron transport protein A
MGKHSSNFNPEQENLFRITDSETETLSTSTASAPPQRRQEGTPPPFPLREVPNGQRVRIVSLPRGESGARLEALGIRPGKIVTKLSGMPFSGPVALELDGRQIAVGHGVSRAILVENVPDP